MNPLFKKLNYKGEKQILSINHPGSFDEALNEMKDDAQIITSMAEVKQIDFAINCPKNLSDAWREK